LLAGWLINHYNSFKNQSYRVISDVSNDTVTVDFPEFLGWEGTLSEVEIVLSVVSCFVNLQ